MGELNIPILDGLEELLLTSTEMEDIRRWKKYVKRREARKENSLQHSYKASLLACIVIENEMRYAGNIDAYKVLKATILHDLGEIKTGDTVYIDKSEERDREEYEFFKDLISRLPEEIRPSFDEAYRLQHSTGEDISILMATKRKELNLFEAIERLGYVVFAYREYKELRKGEKILVQTLRNQHEHLVRLARELPGFGAVFYTPEVQQNMEEFLKQYEGKFIEKKGE